MDDAGKKVIGKPFKKGNKFSKGRPPISQEVKKIQQLTRENVIKTMNELSGLNIQELEEILKDRTKTVHELMLAKVIVEAIKRGDNQRIEWLYQRTIGKMREEVNHTVTHTLHDQFMNYLTSREAPKEEQPERLVSPDTKQE